MAGAFYDADTGRLKYVHTETVCCSGGWCLLLETYTLCVGSVWQLSSNMQRIRIRLHIQKKGGRRFMLVFGTLQRYNQL